MKRITTALPLLAALAAGPATAGDKPIVVDVWPGKPPPGDNLTREADKAAGEVAGPIGPEKFFVYFHRDGVEHKVAGKPTRWLTNVTKPTITIYPAPKNKNTGIAVIICPGGGYHNLGWDVEGEEVAAWLNSVGATGIILKYRVPRRVGETLGRPSAAPIKDAQRALSLVRSRAKEWGIDPQKIGIVGFSAGGHLAATVALNSDMRSYTPTDDIDKVSCRPDFAIPVYSGYLIGNDNDALSADMRVSNDKPPLYLVHATNDSISKPENSVILYLALKKAGAPVELHMYASGEHGFGVRDVGHPVVGWTRGVVEWWRDLGLLKPGKTAAPR